MFADQLRASIEACAARGADKNQRAPVESLRSRAGERGRGGSPVEAIEARRALPPPQRPVQRRLGSRPRSPASMERRRRWAASGALPPQLASRFTLAEQAVLAVIAAEHVNHGALHARDRSHRGPGRRFAGHRQARLE